MNCVFIQSQIVTVSDVSRAIWCYIVAMCINKSEKNIMQHSAHNDTIKLAIDRSTRRQFAIQLFPQVDVIDADYDILDELLHHEHELEICVQLWSISSPDACPAAAPSTRVATCATHSSPHLQPFSPRSSCPTSDRTRPVGRCGCRCHWPGSTRM